MRERDYLRLRRQLEREYRQKLEALELVWTMAGGQSGKTDLGRPGRTAAQQSVRAFLNYWSGGEFSVDDVFSYVQRTVPNVAANRASMSGALRRLAASGEIELVAMGKGNRPSRYRPSTSAKAA